MVIEDIIRDYAAGFAIAVKKCFLDLLYQVAVKQVIILIVGVAAIKIELPL